METEKSAPLLTLVPTPIGNRDDITLRALRTLQEADWIACEDTRRTGQLLAHYEIRDKRLVAYHEHNEEKALPRLLEPLRRGERVALVTDGGTPGVSDPGFRLVRAAIEEELDLTVLPGPSACVTALILSGLPVAGFTFHGFPPKKAGKLRRLLDGEAHSPHTQIFYESPYRVAKLLAAIREAWGERRAAVCRELTKKFEEALRGTTGELADSIARKPIKGEAVVLVEGAGDRLPPRLAQEAQD